MLRLISPLFYRSTLPTSPSNPNIARCSSKIFTQISSVDLKSSFIQKRFFNKKSSETYWPSSLFLEPIDKTVSNKKNTTGRTPLDLAISREDISHLQELLSDDTTNPNLGDSFNQTPLHHAAYRGKLEIVKLLSKNKKIDLNAQDVHGLTPLHHAIMSDRFEVVTYLVSVPDLNYNAQAYDRLTPLHYALKRQNLRIAKSLLNLPLMDIHAEKKQITFLHWACWRGDVEIVRTLVEELKADINSQDEFNNTPLHFAAIYSHPNVWNYLKMLPGIQMNLKNRSNKTPEDVYMVLDARDSLKNKSPRS